MKPGISSRIPRVPKRLIANEKNLRGKNLAKRKKGTQPEGMIRARSDHQEADTARETMPTPAPVEQVRQRVPAHRTRGKVIKGCPITRDLMLFVRSFFCGICSIGATSSVVRTGLLIVHKT